MRVVVVVAVALCCNREIATAQVSPQHLRLAPVARISAIDHDLSVVGLIARGPDGTVWVSQPQDGTVMSFQHPAHLSRRADERGRPAELRSASGMRADSSGLIVFDMILGRVTLFPGNRTAPRTESLTRPGSLVAGAFTVAADLNQVVYLHSPAPPQSPNAHEYASRQLTLFAH